MSAFRSFFRFFRHRSYDFPDVFPVSIFGSFDSRVCRPRLQLLRFKHDGRDAWRIGDGLGDRAVADGDAAFHPSSDRVFALGVDTYPPAAWLWKNTEASF